MLGRYHLGNMLAWAIVPFLVAGALAVPSHEKDVLRHIQRKRGLLRNSEPPSATYWKKRTLETGRISFRECNLEPVQREDCGYYGISEEQCYSRECCYQPSQESNIPPCYHSILTMAKTCATEISDRQSCGPVELRKEQCLAAGCCYKPSIRQGALWCFAEQLLPIHEGVCGAPAIGPHVRSRIVGGIEARPHSWPWMASMQGQFPWSDGLSHFCGASLINAQWAVSAAHCAIAFEMSDEVHLVVGMHSLNESEPSKVSVLISDHFNHPHYGAVDGFDIMLLKLAEPVEFGDEVSPVCLAGEDSDFPGHTRCYTTGWGTLEFRGESPVLLQQVMVPLVDTDTCNAEEWYNGRIMDDTMVCAGYEEGGRDSCQGDSGGPLVCQDEDQWVLVGIVSWGEGCAYDMRPGVYAKVSGALQWMRRILTLNT